jgi:hypothetical protein
VKKKTKKPVVAWVVKADGYDGFGLYGARTERGARGFSRRQAREAGYAIARPSDLKLEVERCGPMDDWIRAQKHRQGLDLQIALYQAQDAQKEEYLAAEKESRRRHFDAGFEVGIGKVNDNDQRCQHLIRQRDEARKALLKIRDVFVVALRRDAREPDKTLCHAGGIAYELARVVPEHAFPPPSPAPGARP